MLRVIRASTSELSGLDHKGGQFLALSLSSVLVGMGESPFRPSTFERDGFIVAC